MLKKRRLTYMRALLLASALLTPLPVSAQLAPVELETTLVCPGSEVIILDGVQQCREPDSLASIIRDLEQLDSASDPLRAGDQGDPDALRELPDVRPEAISAYAARVQALKTRHAAISLPANRSEQDQLNYQLLGFVLEQRTALSSFDAARIPFTNDSGFFNQLSFIARQTSFKTPSFHAILACTAPIWSAALKRAIPHPSKLFLIL